MLSILATAVFAAATLVSQCSCENDQSLDRDLSRGKELLEAGQSKDAIICLTAVIAKDPKNAKAYYYRGCAHAWDGEKPAAIDDFSKAIAIDKKYVNAYVDRGYAYFVALDSERALADFNTATTLDPKNPNAYTGRGIIYEDKKEYRKAVAEYTKASELEPDRSSTRIMLSTILATCIDSDVRDGKKALEHATEACKLTKYNDFFALRSLAASFAELGKFEEAVKWQKKAITLLKNDDGILIDRATDRLRMYEKSMPLRYEHPNLGR